MNTFLTKAKRYINKKIKDDIDISVIIPFHNVERYIAECLDSLFSQHGVSLEVILVNDGSTDNTADIVRSYMKEHNNLHMYDISQQGPGYARNYGVRRARGEFIAFLDADDKLVPGIYRRMIRAARNNDAEVCICNAARFNSKEKWSSDLHEIVYNNYKICTHITETPELIYDTTCWNKLIKRSFYKKNRIRFPEHVVYEDISFNAAVHLKCNRVAMIAETGYLWRVRDGNTDPSITQVFYSERNISDRFIAANWLVDNFLSETIPAELRNAVQRKLLEIDLKIILDSVEHIPAEQAGIVFDEVRSFIESKIEPEVMDSLSLIDLQRYECVRNKDVEGYKRILEYRRNHYRKAPVKEVNNTLEAELPDDLFTVEKRSVEQEFSRMQRRVWVDNVRLVDDEIEVFSHIYIQRYNMDEPGKQKIRAYLINEETNQKLEVAVHGIKTPFLTQNFGDVLDDETGVVTHYNYDYCGFCFRIGKDILKNANRYRRMKYSVVAEYRDKLFSGTQIIKGVSDTGRNRFGTACINCDNNNIRIGFGEQDELQIIVKRI